MRGAFTRRRVTVAAAAVIAAAVSAAVAGAWWVSSVNALSFTGTGGGGAVGMRILRNTGGSD